MYKKKTMEYPKPEPIIPMMLDGEITPYNVSKSSTATTKENHAALTESEARTLIRSQGLNTTRKLIHHQWLR